MVRRSPCERYLKYLIVHPDGYSNDEIRQLAQLQQLDYLGAPYLDRLRSSVTPPLPFYPEDRTHTRSQGFLNSEGLWAIFHPDADMKAAQQALEKPRVKEGLESMLLSMASVEYISAVARHRLNVTMSVRAVQLYKVYFFDVDLVDSTELKALMDSRVQINAEEDPDAKRLSISMLAANKTDPRKEATKIASPQMAALMNSLRMGFLPSNIDMSKLAAAARYASTIQAYNASLHGYAANARDFALVAKAMSEILDSVGDASVDLQSDLTQMLLETDAAEVPQLADLSGSEVLQLPGQSVETNGKPIE